MWHLKPFGSAVEPIYKLKWQCLILCLALESLAEVSDLYKYLYMNWTSFKVACLKHSKFAENNELSKEL